MSFFPCYRRIQLPEGGPAIQARVQLLLDSDLHPVLYAGHRVLGFLLARSERHSRTSVPRRHHPPDHGHPDLRDQRIPAARFLHKSHRRMDRRVSDFRVRSPARVRSGQLRVPLRHAPREHEEAATSVRAGTRCVPGGCRWPSGGRRYHLRHGRRDPDPTFPASTLLLLTQRRQRRSCQNGVLLVLSRLWHGPPLLAESWEARPGVRGPGALPH